MNPLTHKYCKHCNKWFKHYNSSFTKCPCTAKTIINLEKKENAKEASYPFKRGNRKLPKQSLVHGGNDNAEYGTRIYYKRGTGGSRIASERKGKGLYKLTSDRDKLEESVQKTEKTKLSKIKRVSAKQAKINRELSKIKEELINQNDYSCFTCGRVSEDLELSHIIPRSIRPDLITSKGNCIGQCRNYHIRWEHLEAFKVLKFQNLNSILEYIKNTDTGRYIHVTEKLNYQITASR